MLGESNKVSPTPTQPLHAERAAASIFSLRRSSSCALERLQEAGSAEKIIMIVARIMIVALANLTKNKSNSNSNGNSNSNSKSNSNSNCDRGHERRTLTRLLAEE